MRKLHNLIPIVAVITASITTVSVLDTSHAQTTGQSSSSVGNQARRNDQDGCTTKYDRFRNRNTTTLAPRAIMTAGSEELRLGFSAVTEGDAAPREIEWLFDSTTERLRYGNKAEVRFIIDGKRIDGGVAYKSGGYAMRQFNEQLKLKMPVARFLEIIAGREVEMQLGETEVTLRREDLQHLRDFAACVKLHLE